MLNLCIPLVFFILTLVQLAFHHRMTNTEHHIGSFIVKILFLNHVHIIFTFWMLATFPEMKSWLVQRRQGLWRSVLPWTGIFLFFFVLFSVVQPHLRHIGDKNYLGVITTALLIISFHHVYAQSRGLSLLYNRMVEKRFSLTAQEKQKVFSLEKWERGFYTTLIGSQIVWIFMKLCFPHERKIEAAVFLAIASVCVGGIFFCCRRYPYADRSNKTLYSLRLILFPLWPMSSLAVFGALAFHGVEYLLVFLKMYGKSEVPKQNKYIAWYIGSIILLLSLSFARHDLLGFLYSKYISSRGLLTVMASLAGALSFLHYYLDGVIFKMRDSLTREKVAPLLFD